VNWKDWLKEVSTKSVAGIVVLVSASIAALIWPPLRRLAVGHQNFAYIVLALIVGIAIGYFSNTLRKVRASSGTNGVRLDRVANLFWLGSDLQWARQMVERGHQDKITHGLKQACHHASELGLSATSAGQQLLAHLTSIEKMPSKLSDTEKSWAVGQIDTDLQSFSGIMKQYQPDFRPDPYHS